MREVIYNVVRVANLNSGGQFGGQSNGQSDAVKKRDKRKSIARDASRTFNKTLQVPKINKYVYLHESHIVYIFYRGFRVKEGLSCVFSSKH